MKITLVLTVGALPLLQHVMPMTAIGSKLDKLVPHRCSKAVPLVTPARVPLERARTQNKIRVSAHSRDDAFERLAKEVKRQQESVKDTLPSEEGAIVNLPCAPVALNQYRTGRVFFEFFPLSCFEEIKRLELKPTQLSLNDAHLATAQHIKQIDWTKVSAISGKASFKMNAMPWWLLSQLEVLDLDFDLKGAAPISRFALSTIPRIVRYLELRNIDGYDEQVSYLLSKLGKKLRKLSLRGDSLTLDPRSTAAHLRGNSNLQSLILDIKSNEKCGIIFDFATRVLAESAPTSLEKLHISCANYDETQLRMVLEAFNPNENSKITLNTGSLDIVAWMEKVLMIGDLARSKGASVSFTSPGEKSGAEISFGHSTKRHKIEVQREWLENVVKIAEKYGNTDDIQRVFTSLFHGFYSRDKGIKLWEHELYENLINSYPTE